MNSLNPANQPAFANGIFLPQMSVKAFAKAQSMSEESVRTQIRLGNLPAIKQGKYLYINMVALNRRCAEEHERYTRSVAQGGAA